MVKILFVCLGNICRSPSAEAVMNAFVKTAGLEDGIKSDSAGTIGMHAGHAADSRMKKYASKRGFDLTSISRQIKAELDFEEFDMIIAMDHSNYLDIMALDTDGSYKDKICKMTDFCTAMEYGEVPDPYYGGDEGFELVLDILEDSCRGLLDAVKGRL